MCVRTVAGAEDEPRLDDNPPPPSPTPTSCPFKQQQQQQPAKSALTKAKEKYMRLHDQMLENEQLEQLKQQRHHEAVASHDDDPDILATSTRLYKKLARSVAHRLAKCRDSKIYKILFCTTQPAHVIMIAAVLCVTSALLPNGSSPSPDRIGQPRSRLTAFVYLASFVLHFGSQIWMTFVSGLSLYFALPRHAFGEVQRVLFPRYFTMNACLSLTTLLIYVKHHPASSWDSEIAVQVMGMGGAFFLELLIRLYLTPPLLRLIDVKTSLERAAGVGMEIGQHEPGPLKHCPHYLKIHKAFRKIHMTIAMGNMLTMACTVIHLHYIASKLCVL